MTITTTTTYDVHAAGAPSEISTDVQRTEHDVQTTLLLPEPDLCGLCGDSIAALAMLLTKADQQDRTASRRIEDAADQAASREENDRVEQLQAKARADASESLATGLASIGEGVCMAGATITDASIFNDAAKGAHGIGDLFASQAKGDLGRADAGAAKFEAQAQADIRRYGQAHEDAQAANESIQKVEQFLNNVQQTENATRLATATYRA